MAAHTRLCHLLTVVVMGMTRLLSAKGITDDWLAVRE
jgi:hypothetical protein